MGCCNEDNFDPPVPPVPLSNYIWCGGRETYPLDTPHLVAGAIAFDPTVATISSIKFRVVAAIGDVINGTVELYNLTDSVSVTTLAFASTASTLQVSGDILGLFPAASKIYEVRIYLDAAPGGNDSIELYSAFLEVVPS